MTGRTERYPSARLPGEHRRALDPAERARYGSDGYVVLRQVFTADRVAEWAEECDRLWQMSEILSPENLRTQVVGSDRQVDRLDPVRDLSPVLGDVAADATLLTLVGELLGDDARLFKDKLIFKPPGAGGYLTHQDFAYWQWLPASPSSLLTVMVAIDGSSHANGAVEFFPGLHDRLLTPEGRPEDVDEASITTPGETVQTVPGDVVVFHSLVPHRSGPNRSTEMRRQLYLSYAAGAHGDLYQSYYEGLHGSLLVAMTDAARARAFFR
jgi:ectoine hydroxylase-related dioxygenase (phytanoyl-CoA dioxygenase family)